MWNGRKSLGQLIVFRVLQGLAGGRSSAFQPGCAAADAFPPEKQGMAMTLFGFAALLAPIVGPTLGGWITDSYSWRWIFFINVPVGLVAFAACYALLRDPDYLTKEREELRKQPFRLVRRPAAPGHRGGKLGSDAQQGAGVGLAGRSVWRVQTLAAFFAVGLIALIMWELRHPNPVVNFRPMRSEISVRAASSSFACARRSMLPAHRCLGSFIPLRVRALNAAWLCRRAGSLRSSQCLSWAV